MTPLEKEFRRMWLKENFYPLAIPSLILLVGIAAYCWQPDIIGPVCIGLGSIAMPLWLFIRWTERRK